MLAAKALLPWAVPFYRGALHQACSRAVHSSSSNAVDTTSSPISTSSSDGVFIIPMPKLSHQHLVGMVSKWRKQAGEEVDLYDVVMEVDVDDLVEEVYKVGDFAGRVTLLVESQEDGYLAQIMVPEGPTPVAVGTPLAVMTDTKERWDQLQASGFKVPTSNVYDESQPQVKVLPWQSYLKTATRQVKCMG